MSKSELNKVTPNKQESNKNEIFLYDIKNGPQNN